MYKGPERRRHHLYLTRNSEYHVRDGVCVAVRDRISGQWLDQHAALGKRLGGGIRFGGGHAEPHPEDALPGDVLCFAGPTSKDSIMTSALQEVRRPPREALAHYRSPPS